VNTPTDNVTLSTAEGEALIARVHQSNLSADDAGMVERVVRLYFWVAFALQEAKLSVKRLRDALFGAGRPPKTPPASQESPASRDVLGQGEVVSDAEAAECAGAPGPSESEAVPQPKGGHRVGTGRLGAAAYKGAKRVECRHEELAVGQRCPVCGLGQLYTLPPGVEIRMNGNALLAAIRYEVEKLRCSACGLVFTAPLPAEAGAEKYSPRARAVLVVSRYYLGLPLYRIEAYQAMLGVPVPDATQWEQIERVADCGYVVFAYLEGLAAQGTLIHQDDTSVRILAFLKENQAAAAERTGMYTTVLMVQVGERRICLYYSGRAHAGENLGTLLRQRQAGQALPLVMSDALTSNAADETALIRCHCLAHGRRKFSDLEEVFPQECQVVLAALKQVFDHEEEARDHQMSPAQRLAYHQTVSRPIMDGLKRWLDQQRAERLVEPNSSLGKAMAYLQNHWETLTRFLTIEGAPLDNNLAERALKLFIRQRKNSLFSATEHSAYIASILTSLIATCVQAGVNAVEYLVALQDHRHQVCADPGAWLPWTYQATLAPP
jgi:transposase